jgi:hypothetical protein
MRGDQTMDTQDNAKPEGQAELSEGDLEHVSGGLDVSTQPVESTRVNKIDAFTIKQK